MSRGPRILFAGLACFAATFTACSQADESAAPDSAEFNSAELDSAENGSADFESGETDEAEVIESEGSSIPVPESDEPAQDRTDTPPLLDGLPGDILVRDGDGQIVVLAPDGMDSQVLSNSNANHTQPTWSNTGDLVAWSSFGADGATLSVADRNGTNIANLSVPTPAFYLSWSANDSWIAGLRPTATGMEMFIADGAAATQRPISSAQPFYFEWTSDSDIIAALGNRLLVDVPAAATTQPLARPLPHSLGAFQAPGVLSGGDVLAALNIDGTNTLARISGDIVSEIATATSPIFLTVSPDEEHVAVLTPATAAQQAESQEISFQIDQPAALPTGRVSILTLATGEVRELPDQQVVSLSWSPDSSTLALLAATPTGFEWRFNTDGETTSGSRFEPTREFLQSYLPFFDQYNRSTTPWSPNSEAIVFAGTITGQAGVFVDVVSDDLGPVKISDGSLAFWSPS